MPMINMKFDPYGSRPANLVSNEPHTLSPNTVPIFHLAEGGFYTDTLVVYDVVSGTALPQSEYKAAAIDHDLFALTGKTCGFGVQILRQNPAGNYLVTAQMVGGKEGFNSRYYDRLAEAIETALDDNLSWDDIDHPDVFPPEEHTHPLTHLTDLELVSSSLRGLTEALKANQTVGTTGFVLSERLDRLTALLGALRADLNNGTGGASGVSLDMQLFEDNLVAITELTAMQANDLNLQNTRLSELEDSYMIFTEQLSAMFTTQADLIVVDD